LDPVFGFALTGSSTALSIERPAGLLLTRDFPCGASYAQIAKVNAAMLDGGC
jgi:hypothetical protein